MATSTTPAPRRTQAERRAQTQAALLDATLQSLVELGYAGTTTRGVAERAGVTQGALQYHYPTKFALVNAALLHISKRFSDETLANADPTAPTADRAALVLDALWNLHRHPAVAAAHEIFTTASSDPALAAPTANSLTRTINAAIRAAGTLLPEHAHHPRFRETMLLAIAAIHGTARIATIPGADDAHAGWPATKKHLMQTLDDLAPRTRSSQAAGSASPPGL